MGEPSRQPSRVGKAVTNASVSRVVIGLRDRIWANAVEIPGNGIDDDNNGFVDDVNGWNFETNSGNVGGTFFHGTATAGMAVARTNNISGVCGIAGGFTPVDGCKGMILAVGNSAPQTALVDASSVSEKLQGGTLARKQFGIESRTTPEMIKPPKL